MRPYVRCVENLQSVLKFLDAVKLWYVKIMQVHSFEVLLPVRDLNQGPVIMSDIDRLTVRILLV